MNTPPPSFFKISMSRLCCSVPRSECCTTPHAASRGGAPGLTDPAPACERTTDCSSAPWPGMIRVFDPCGPGGSQCLAPTQERASGSTASRCCGLSRGRGGAVDSIIGGHDSARDGLGWARVRLRPGGREVHCPDVRGGRRDVWRQGGTRHRRGALSLVDMQASGGVRA